MRLGLNMGYWTGGPPPGALETVQEAERLGFDSLWTAEAYGSDTLTSLAWWGSHTERLRLGTAIMQIPGRTPAMTAMSAMSLDHLSGGRFCLGLGASGPQVVEGWHGQEFGRPLRKMREYVAIVREMVAREGPVSFEGEYYRLPVEGGTGLGKPLKSSIHPLRTDLPMYLAAEGPKNIALSAELFDGWLAIFYSPSHEALYREALAEGFARDGARRRDEDFEVLASVPVVIGDDAEACADALRPMYALYFGGMGARGRNFHADVAIRMGYEAEVEQIQEAFLAGRKDDAAALVPTRLVEQLALVGPADKIRHDLQAWEDSRVDVMLVSGDRTHLRAVAEIVQG